MTRPTLEFVTINARYRRQTEKAVQLDYDDEEIWIPLSQIEHMEETPEGLTRITMSAWIAKEKGIIS